MLACPVGLEPTHCSFVSGAFGHPDDPTRTLACVSSLSLRALRSAHCIAVLDDVPSGRAIDEIADQREELIHHPISVLPLGRELHRILSTVDWREIARRRGST